MAYQTILYDVAEGIATITLNRPDKLNSFTPGMVDELIDAIDQIDADDSARVVIFTGAGRGFCAGADLSAGADAFNRDKVPRGEANPGRDGGGRLTLRLYDCKKPLIAAVNGPSAGVGVTMTLAMDIRMCSTAAKFGLVFARRGVVMEACSSWFLPRAVGMQTAMEWASTGRVFGPDEALEKRLVRSVHAPEDLLPAARALGREIAENTSGVSVALCRQMMWKGLGYDHPMASHILESKNLQGYMGKMPDSREGVTSFFEKRKPNFTMSPAKDMPGHYPWWTTPEFKL